MIYFLANQELYVDRLTETSITVYYTAEAGVTGSQMVARNGKVGRFFGACDATRGTCTVSGLSAGFNFEIWVRTCGESGPARCVLRAMSAQMVTYPKGMFWLFGKKCCNFSLIKANVLKAMLKANQ